MEIFYFASLAVLAFCLGACPFSLWVGKWLLGKDIRSYGDGNPGAINVFRAGGRKAFALAMFLDIGKGIPFVFLAHSYFELPQFVSIEPKPAIKPKIEYKTPMEGGKVFH